MPSSSPKAAANQPDRRRRRYPRFRADFRVRANYLVGNEYRKLQGHCRDLSEAGIGILLAADLNSGDVVGLHFTLPGLNSAWEICGVVRFRHGYHYGFEFLALASEQQRLLKNFLKGLQRSD